MPNPRLIANPLTGNCSVSAWTCQSLFDLARRVQNLVRLEIETLQEDKPELEIETLQEDKPELEIETLQEDKPELEIETLQEDKPELEIETLQEDKPELEIETFLDLTGSVYPPGYTLIPR
jgi:hypothetical protein